MDKVKILITGPVNGKVKDLTQKLNTLQKSKAGPFDACFCTGPFFSSEDDLAASTKSILSSMSGSADRNQNQDPDTAINLPLPVYFCDVGHLPKGCELNLYEKDGSLKNFSPSDVKKDDDEIEISMDDENEPEPEPEPEPSPNQNQNVPNGNIQKFTTLEVKQELIDQVIHTRTPQKESPEVKIVDNDNDTNEKDQLPKGIIALAHNLYLLHGVSIDQIQTADVINVPIEPSATSRSNSESYLTVAFIPPNARMGSAQTAKLESKTNHASFVGVDLLLTSDWGQGMASSSCISNDDSKKLGLDTNSTSSSNGSIIINTKEIGSYDIAELASQCRPRYHIAPALKQQQQQQQKQQDKDKEATETETETYFFFQSIPYRNPPSPLASGVLQNYHITRFLALCPVVDSVKQKKNGKAKKYIHALGIQPLWSMDRTTATAIPDNIVVVPSPYTDDCYQKDKQDTNMSMNMNANMNANMNRNANRNANINDRGNYGKGVGPGMMQNVGLSEAQTRRIMSEDAEKEQNHRWNIRNRKRSQPGDGAFTHEMNMTLFLHGLHNDPSGGMTLNRDSIREAFEDQGCTMVRYPHSHADGHPSYCFLDFGSHEEAKRCLETSGGEAQVSEIPLALKWSSGGRRNGAPPPPPPPGHVGIYGHSNGAQQPPNKRNKTRLTEAEASDSSSLFVHLNLRADAMSPELCSRGIECVGKMAQTALENAINADTKEGEERVTADDEPALKVTARPLLGKNCGFLDFASHAAASMALATMTGSTDGGETQNQQIVDDGDGTLKDVLRQVQLWWARAKEKDTAVGNNKHGFQFRSQHFPPDARTDCWFCLASPTCEKHLIVSISDTCYITMPKGPVNENHALIVPVNHSASEGTNKRPILGAFLDPTPGATADLEKAKDNLRKYASDELDKDLFVFERAIPTRGGYHAHINCIPVERGLGSKIRSTMLSMAASAGFVAETKEFRELQNPDISVTSILKNSDEDELGGYFYAEVPFGENGDFKRFIYTSVEKEGGARRRSVPLQFGREVLAAVMGNENLAHWKGCVLSTETEEKYTQSFREKFGKYE